jgi:hypothetical protein
MLGTSFSGLFTRTTTLFDWEQVNIQEATHRKTARYKAGNVVLGAFCENDNPV